MTLRLIATIFLAVPGLFADIVTNGSFETPALTPGSFAYNPTGAMWTFTGQSGIQTNGSAWGFLTAPDGTQTAFLQVFGTLTSNFSETLTGVSAGTVISFFEAQRPGYGVNSFNVTYNGTVLGSFTAGSTTWTNQSVTIPLGALSSGTLSFVSTGATGSDLDVGIDNVRSTATPTVPEPGSLILFSTSLGMAALIRRKFRKT